MFDVLLTDKFLSSWATSISTITYTVMELNETRKMKKNENVNFTELWQKVLCQSQALMVC